MFLRYPHRAAAWTSEGTSHEHRGLKHRPDGAIRKVTIPPILVRTLRIHASCLGTVPDGRLFPGARGGLLSESVYGRAWHTARPLALGPRLAATALARRPYDLRHAALSLWPNAGAPPAQIAARAGHSVTVLLTVYAHCIDGQDQITNRLIERASGAYVNTLSDEGADGVHRAYPPHKLARLAAVKHAYDPDNAFHLNQNIPPRRPEHAQAQGH